MHYARREMNSVELRQLEQFVAVAEEGQFTRAAERCGIAQSALSTSIRVLEEDLGAQLFLRTTRRVTLTEAGRALLTEARRTLIAADAARTAVHETQALLRGRLAIGGISTVNLLDQPALLRRFCAKHPGVNIRYRRADSNTLIADVRDGRLDVAFVSLPVHLPASLRAIDLVTAPIMLCCHAGHRLAERTEVTMAELAKESLVGMPSASSVVDDMHRVFAGKGIRLTVPYEVNDIPTMFEFVEHGLAVTLTVEAFAAGHPALRSVPIAGTPMVWTLALITPAPEQTTAAASELISLLPRREVTGGA
jgi:DNA-binding transcriptional LysR family regulator